MISIDDLESRTLDFQRTHYGPPIFKMVKIRHLENRHDVIFFCREWSDLHKISQTGAEWHVDCGDMVEIETRCRIPIWRTFGRIYGISSQSHLPHCRVLPPAEFNVTIPELPLGEFTVIIPQPHATLQDAVSWWNQCHDRATWQSVRIPSALLKIIFAIFLFCFLKQFWLWRAPLSYRLRYTCIAYTFILLHFTHAVFFSFCRAMLW